MNIHLFLLPPNATKVTKVKTHKDKENARGCIIITDLADLRKKKLIAKLAVGKVKKNLFIIQNIQKSQDLTSGICECGKMVGLKTGGLIENLLKKELGCNPSPDLLRRLKQFLWRRKLAYLLTRAK